MKKLLFLFLLLFLMFSVGAKSQNMAGDTCSNNPCPDVYWDKDLYGNLIVYELTFRMTPSNCWVRMFYTKRSGWCEGYGDLYEFNILRFKMYPTDSCPGYNAADCLLMGQRWLIEIAKSKFNIPDNQVPFNLLITKKVCWHDPELQDTFKLVRPCPGFNPCCHVRYECGYYKQTGRIRAINSYPFVDTLTCPPDDPQFNQCNNYCHVYVPRLTIPPEPIVFGGNIPEINVKTTLIKEENDILYIGINSGIPGDVNLRIYNMLGNVIYFENRKQGEADIEFQVGKKNFLNGIYFIVIDVNNKNIYRQKYLVY